MREELDVQTLFQTNYIQTTETHSYHHNIFLDSDIDDPQMYRDFISILFNAGEDDIVNIFINSNGGHLSTTLSIVEGLKYTRAHVTAILIGACHSAASIITMYCHEVIVMESAHSMIHTASFGYSGNTGNIKAHTVFNVDMIEKLLHETYEGFLTKDELIKIKDGVEIWLDADGIRQRMVSRLKYLKSQQKKTKKVEE